MWLKIVRSGDTITGYQSSDGTSWQSVGTVTITMGASVQIGLAVISHNRAELCQAAFDSVLTSSVSPCMSLVWVCEF